MSNNSETRTYFIPIKYRTKIFIKVYINIYNYYLIFLITLVMIGKMDSKMLQQIIIMKSMDTKFTIKNFANIKIYLNVKTCFITKNTKIYCFA